MFNNFREKLKSLKLNVLSPELSCVCQAFADLKNKIFLYYENGSKVCKATKLIWWSQKNTECHNEAFTIKQPQSLSLSLSLSLTCIYLTMLSPKIYGLRLLIYIQDINPNNEHRKINLLQLSRFYSRNIVKNAWCLGIDNII
jgi:hypothetical protein